MYIYIYTVNVHVQSCAYMYTSTDIRNVHEIRNDPSENTKNVGNHHTGGSMILPAPLAAFHLMAHPQDLAYFRIFASAWIFSNNIGTKYPDPQTKGCLSQSSCAIAPIACSKSNLLHSLQHDKDMVKDIKDLSHLAWIPSRNEPHLQLPVNKGCRIADHIIKIPVLHRFLVQIQETNHSGQHGSCQ